MKKDIYDLDVAVEIIAQMKMDTKNAYDMAQDPEEKESLGLDLDVLRAEAKALYFDNLMQRSVIDKAFRLYGPILKAQYAAA